LLTDILSQLLTEKSRSQHKLQITKAAAAKKVIALKDVGCKLAIHPKKEEAMHPATK
jgi:hypothetical protein